MKTVHEDDVLLGALYSKMKPLHEAKKEFLGTE